MASESTQFPITIKTEEIEIVSELPDGEPHPETSGSPMKQSPEVPDTNKFKCFICTTPVSLADEASLQEHLSNAHAPRPTYACSECDNWYTDEIASFNQHLSKHHSGAKPLKCSVCSLRFSTEQKCWNHEVRQHGIDHGGIGSYGCSICGAVYSYRGGLKRHQLTKHGIVEDSGSKVEEKKIVEKKVGCYICETPVLLSGKESLKQHLMMVHAPQKTYRCGHCEYSTDSIVIFNDHLIRHDDKSRPYKCNHCTLRFTLPIQQKVHETRKHGVDHGMRKEHRCSFCGKEFYNKNEMRVHERMHTKDDTGRDNLKCYLCQTSYVLDSQIALQQHLVESHEPRDVYQCTECSYCVGEIISFNFHLSRHDASEKPYACTVCSVRFTMLRSKLIHEETQHGIDHQVSGKKKPYHQFEKKFSCPICEKKFPFEVYLKRHHELSHQGEPTNTDNPTNKCYLCTSNISFPNAQTLLAHLDDAHPVQGAYHCPNCDYSAQQKANYNHHLALHDPTLRPHKCNFCAMRYKSRRSMQQHEAKVHGALNSTVLVCSQCDKTFTSQSRLRRHVMTKHLSAPREIEEQKVEEMEFVQIKCESYDE